MKELVATKNASFACSALISRIRFLPESSNQRCLLSFKANQQQRNIGTQVVQVKCFWKSQNAAARNDVEAIGVPTSVPVRVAHELVQAGHRYLDVRTPEEFSAGHAAAAVNVPYMYRVGSGMTKNPHFIAEVSQHFKKDNEIIVGCQSGKRSMMAATDLVAAGFTGITDIAGGYAAWTQNSLPTEFGIVLARRAFRALKSLVKLQALVRGVCARKQARIALHCMHALAKLHISVRGRQLLSTQ